MKILISGFGNKKEAFVQESYADGVNIITSDDNNRGKTLVIQSLMYSLGNEPNFPMSFEPREYYHYVRFSHNDKEYEICRNNKDYIICCDEGRFMLNGVAELKRFLNKHVFTFPFIPKDGRIKMVDPVLFYQLTFVGQDKKNSSTIAHAGYYNKDDFYEMMYSLRGISENDSISEENENIRKDIKRLEEEKKILLKEHKILSAPSAAVSVLSVVAEREQFGKKVMKLEELNEKMSSLKKERNRCATRRAKWSSTLSELKSLNRNLHVGQLRCMDCQSTNVELALGEKSSFSFNVSTPEMRNDIQNSIDEKIKDYSEEIEKLDYQIEEIVKQIKVVMEDEDVTLDTILAYKDDVFSAEEAERRILDVDEKLAELKGQRKSNIQLTDELKKKRESLNKEMVNELNRIYSEIDSNHDKIENLFTKRDDTMSGSEQTAFYISKMLLFEQFFHSPMPIIMDSFRAEELSTEQEANALGLFKKAGKQVILSATLKTQERGKYDDQKEINSIDYSEHTPHHILNGEYVGRFSELLSELGLSMQDIEI